MGYHSFEFVLVENFQKSGSHANNGVFLVASSSESVWCRIIHDVESRHRKSCGDREVLGSIPEIKVVLSYDRFSFMKCEYDFIREPIRKYVHKNSQENRYIENTHITVKH